MLGGIVSPITEEAARHRGRLSAAISLTFGDVAGAWYRSLPCRRLWSRKGPSTGTWRLRSPGAVRPATSRAKVGKPPDPCSQPTVRHDKSGEDEKGNCEQNEVRRAVVHLLDEG